MVRNTVVPLSRAVGVVLSDSVSRWDMDNQATQAVVMLAVTHVMRACSGTLALYMGGDELSDALREKVRNIFLQSFAMRGYTSYSICEIVCDEEKDIPREFSRLRKECVRIYRARECTGRRFDIVGDVHALRGVEDALLFGACFQHNGVYTPIPKHVFKYIYPKANSKESGMFSW